MSEPENLLEYLRRTRRERKIQSVLVRGREAALQADTAMRSAANTLTFGQANKAAAAAVASFGGVESWSDRYQANLAKEEARDQYDSVYRRQAQEIGELGGLGASVLVRGPLAGLANARRLRGAAKLTPREIGSILVAGGVVGAGAQAVGDLTARDRSSPQDYAGAAVGGMAGVIALPFGPARAAAVDGAVTSAAQDYLVGRPVSLRDATQSALIARTLGGIADEAATAYTAALPPVKKGRLGETMGRIRSVADGRPREPSKPKRQPATSNPKGPKWDPDGVHIDPWGGDPLWLEDKFGWNPTVSTNQRLAEAMLKSDFQLNHFLPVDVGRAAAVPAAAAGIQTQERIHQR